MPKKKLEISIFKKWKAEWLIVEEAEAGSKLNIDIEC